MDNSVGSTRVPEYSANLSESVLRVGNKESLKCSEEQNPSKPQTAPKQPAVRFKIRSAKERKQLLTNACISKSETFEKASRSIKESREEMPRVHTTSPSSTDSAMIDTRRPSALNQLILPKKAELSISSETSTTTQKKPESPTINVRGRTEWRQAYLSNRSKSLDWRGSKSDGGKENPMDVIRNTKDLGGRSIRRSESLERNDAAKKPNPKELAPPLKRVSLQIQPFNGTGQRMQDRKGLISSAVSGTSPVRMVALAQSFPSRPKENQIQDRTEEIKIPLHSGHSGTKPDEAEHHLRSKLIASKFKMFTGNHTVKGRAACNVVEDNSEATLGFHRWERSSMDSRQDFSKGNKVLYYPEKCGTFPNPFFKNEEMKFTTLPDTSVVLPGKDNLSTWSKGKPLGQDSVSLVTNNNTYEERRLTGHSTGQGNCSLGRTRNRYFTAPISYSVHSLDNSNSNSIQKGSSNDIEKQAEIMTRNVKLQEKIPGKQPHSSPEGVNLWTNSQSSQSMIADSEKNDQQEHGVDLEFGSSGNPYKKGEGMLEKVKEPPLASVRNRIHKFEALALQNQTDAHTHPSPRIQYHRRALSVTENPKVVASVNKTYSDRSFGMRWRDRNSEYLRENLFSKSEVSDEAVSMNDLSGPVEITIQDKEESTVKTQSRGTKLQEPAVVQTLKLQDESDHKNEAKYTMMNKQMDQPDFSKGSHLRPYQKLKNIKLTDEKVMNDLSSPKSQKTSGITNNSTLVSHANLQDFSHKTESKISKSTKDKADSSPVLPNSGSSNPVKSIQSRDNSAHSKSPSNLLSDSGVIIPLQVFSSTSADLSHPYNTIKDEKVAAKVIRWIMDKGVDDENDEDEDDEDDDEGTERGYDSDSGESSVTITSNMSSRSFSMSLVELCSLGGLDLPPSDGIGSKDDENWMSKRTISISSDVSALSSVTLLGMDELECLLNDVKALEDDALEDYEDVHVIVLHKEAGCGLGFTVAGGVDQNKPVTVHKVLRNGIAAQEGSIHVSDQVLSINGTALHNSTHKEALYTMRKARGRTMAVVVVRRGDVIETCYSIKDSPQKAVGSPGSRVHVTLNKSRSDLGFSLEGGVGSSLGDKPLTVQRIFQGGPVGKVFPGDELLEVEGQSLEGLRRLEVWHLIKRLPPGPVEVLLQRPLQLY